ncbi:MAG: glycoside hydrolase family 3 N-terminal domain-containing protein [Muribaculaceae bacterium]
MKKNCKYLISIVLAGIVATAVVAANKQPKVFNGVDRDAMDTWVDTTMRAMTLDEKIGQLIVMQTLTQDDKANLAVVRKNVEEYKIGGLLFSKGDIATQAKVCNFAQSLARIPLMVTADAEWGLSMRLKDAPVFPKNMILGAIDDDRLLYEYGREMARECRAIGIHVNFAPVLDVNDNPDNPAIGLRSFGESPETVARKGIAYAKGMEDNGVITVAKHFPGHGNPSTDSHKVLPTVNKTLSELKMCELLPFRRYVDAGLSGIMVAHLYVPAVDKRRIPSSMSDIHVTRLLRQQLGFEGLVFTDGLGMRGADMGESNCVTALIAGVDILLSPRNLGSDIAAIKAAVESGRISEQSIDERCAKVLRYKYLLELSKPQSVDAEHVVEAINSPEATKVARRLWAGAITVLKNSKKQLPITRIERKKIAVLTLGSDEGTSTMFQNRCAMYSPTDRYNYRAGEAIAPLEKKLSDYDVVIIANHADNAAYRSAMTALVSKLDNVVSVIFAKPYNLKEYKYVVKHSQSVVLAYENCTIAQDYAAQTIYGGNAARGVMPVTVKGVAKVGDGVKFAATRLGYTIPEEQRLSSSMLAKIDSLALKGIDEKAFPGCQVLVARNGKVVCNRCYGVTDTKTNTPVTVNTLYDLASVSKATGTLPGIMKLYDRGMIKLDDKASKYIPQLLDGDKNDITIRDLLFHETGMPPALNMNDVMIDSESYKGPLFRGRRDATYSIPVSPTSFGNRYARLRSDITSTKRSDVFSTEVAKGIFGGTAAYDTIMQRIYSAKLRPSKDYLYSCLNFCLLMNVEQNITHSAHNDFVEKNFFAPLGAYHTMYRPLDRFSETDIAPTEHDTFLRRQIVRGFVHDETAAFSGGVQGNAGLFSNANDLAKLCQMWLNGGEYGGDRYLKKSTVETFCKEKSPNSRRGLGFDKPDKNNDNYSPTCGEATAATFGHLGFTGTAFWVDPDNGLIFIFLCNRVYPTRHNAAFNSMGIRPELFSIVYQSLKD